MSKLLEHGSLLNSGHYYFTGVALGQETGACRRDLPMWAWDDQNWSALHPANTIPPARVDAGLAYSPVDSGLVLYGGRTSLNPSGVHLDDTWIWNGSWVQANTTTSSKMISEIAGMTYDTVLNAVVLIGGDLVWVWGDR
jgi:hypothetical protein